MFFGFVFWTVFRSFVAFLAHFNWLAAFKIKCVYEIYMMIYGLGNATESEVELGRIETVEKKELKNRALRRSMKLQAKEKAERLATLASAASKTEEPELSSASSTDSEVEELIKQGLADPNKKTGFKAANLRQVVRTKYQDLKNKAEDILLPKQEGEEEENDSSTEGHKKKIKKWDAIKGIYKWVTAPEDEKKLEEGRPLVVEVNDTPRTYPLYPNYSNMFDMTEERRSKRRNEFEGSLKRRRRKSEGNYTGFEKNYKIRRKLLTDAIDLLLNMLRMVTMFALVTWNIRKHNPIGAFKHLEIDFDPEQNDEDIDALREGTVSTRWVIALSITVFLDVFMSLIQFLIACYQQARLFKRMGPWWSLFWFSILISVSGFVMVFPMFMLLGSLDVSWCRVVPHTDMACWMPPHWVDFPLDDPRISCNWWFSTLEGGEINDILSIVANIVLRHYLFQYRGAEQYNESIYRLAYTVSTITFYGTYGSLLLITLNRMTSTFMGHQKHVDRWRALGRYCYILAFLFGLLCTSYQIPVALDVFYFSDGRADPISLAQPYGTIAAIQSIAICFALTLVSIGMNWCMATAIFICCRFYRSSLSLPAHTAITSFFTLLMTALQINRFLYYIFGDYKTVRQLDWHYFWINDLVIAANFFSLALTNDPTMSYGLLYELLPSIEAFMCALMAIVVYRVVVSERYHLATAFFKIFVARCVGDIISVLPNLLLRHYLLMPRAPAQFDDILYRTAHMLSFLSFYNLYASVFLATVNRFTSIHAATHRHVLFWHALKRWPYAMAPIFAGICILPRLPAKFTVERVEDWHSDWITYTEPYGMVSFAVLMP
ncbi:unnamed protein product, partial [Mesorhabditis spiculigera]